MKPPQIRSKALAKRWQKQRQTIPICTDLDKKEQFDKTTKQG
jgi:hypothetical protein